MRRGKNYPLFGKPAVQRAGVQKLPANSPQQADGSALHRNRYSEIGKNAGADSVVAFIVFRFDDARRRDVDGAVATVCDALVRAGILADDDTANLSGICATSVRVPKGQAGVDITLRYEQ